MLFCARTPYDWPIISCSHSQNKYHMAGVTRFVLAGWNNSVSGLHHHHRCCSWSSCLCLVLVLAALSGRTERPGPPQTQGVVLPLLLLWHHTSASLRVGGGVALAVGGPRELPLATGCRQQWHEGMKAVMEKGTFETHISFNRAQMLISLQSNHITATQCAQAGRHGQDDLLKFKSSFRIRGNVT